MGLFAPKRYVARVERIDLGELWDQGARALLLDRDNTLVPRDRATAPDSVAQWLDEARARGFKLCMVSNNWHRDQVARSSAELELDWIAFACKPLPFALGRALRRLGVERSQAVMIGDQLFTDVLAGRFAGIDAILVKPQAKKDLWYTHIFRIFERLCLSGVRCEE